MKYILLSSVLFLTGCASCHSDCFMGMGPGNSVFDSYASYSNRSDPCQFVGKVDGYVLPNYCFHNRGKTVRVVTDKNGKLLYLIK